MTKKLKTIAEVAGCAFFGALASTATIYGITKLASCEQQQKLNENVDCKFNIEAFGNPIEYMTPEMMENCRELSILNVQIPEYQKLSLQLDQNLRECRATHARHGSDFAEKFRKLQTYKSYVDNQLQSLLKRNSELESKFYDICEKVIRPDVERLTAHAVYESRIGELQENLRCLEKRRNDVQNKLDLTHEKQTSSSALASGTPPMKQRELHELELTKQVWKSELDILNNRINEKQKQQMSLIFLKNKTQQSWASDLYRHAIALAQVYG